MYNIREARRGGYGPPGLVWSPPWEGRDSRVPLASQSLQHCWLPLRGEFPNGGLQPPVWESTVLEVFPGSIIILIIMLVNQKPQKFILPGMCQHQREPGNTQRSRNWIASFENSRAVGTKVYVITLPLDRRMNDMLVRETKPIWTVCEGRELLAVCTLNCYSGRLLLPANFVLTVVL